MYNETKKNKKILFFLLAVKMRKTSHDFEVLSLFLLEFDSKYPLATRIVSKATFTLIKLQQKI
jgi:hypothetical protein